MEISPKIRQLLVEILEKRNLCREEEIERISSIRTNDHHYEFQATGSFLYSVKMKPKPPKLIQKKNFWGEKYWVEDTSNLPREYHYLGTADLLEHLIEKLL